MRIVLDGIVVKLRDQRRSFILHLVGEKQDPRGTRSILMQVGEPANVGRTVHLPIRIRIATGDV